MFDASVISAIKAKAVSYGWTFAALAAVVEVESNGKAYDIVNGKRFPLIRIEGHYFYRLLSGAKRDRAVREGLAHPNAGRVKNPGSQQARYSMLARMVKIDRNAAIMSCSWGVGQVMGEHYSRLGFDSPDAFRAHVMSSLENQIDVMCRYIVKFGLADEILRQDWAGFARGYNGKNYKKYAYHTKMANAFGRYSKGAVAAPIKPATGMLRLGSEGTRVRELQVLLRRAGYTVGVDGDFGPATKKALMAYQADHGLTVDGVAGPETMAMIKANMQPTETPGVQGPLELPEAKSAAGGVGGAVALETAKDQVNEVLVNNGAALPDWAVTGLSGAAAAIAIAGLAWWAYGWYKSRKTIEQPGEVT